MSVFIRRDRYEAVSNISAMAAVAAGAALSALVFLNHKPLAANTELSSVISIEYAEFSENILPSPEISCGKTFAREIEPEPALQEETVNEEIKKTEKISEEKISGAPSFKAPDEASSGVCSSAAAADLSGNAEFLNYFLGLVQQSLYYPKSARKAGITGKVEIKVTFGASGEIKSAVVTETKHSEILGKAAIKTMERVSREWRPDEFSHFLKPHKEQSVIIPISFELQ